MDDYNMEEVDCIMKQETSRYLQPVLDKIHKFSTDFDKKIRDTLLRLFEKKL